MQGSARFRSGEVTPRPGRTPSRWLVSIPVIVTRKALGLRQGRCILVTAGVVLGLVAVVVVQAGKTTVQDINRALAMLPREKVLGLILNRTDGDYTLAAVSRMLTTKGARSITTWPLVPS